MAQRKDLGELPEFFFDTTDKVPCYVKSVLQKDVPEKYNLSADEIALFEHWNRFLQNTKTRDGKLPGFPIWTEYFPDAVFDMKDLPKWKKDIIEKNIDYYRHNKAFIDVWLKDGESVKLFFGAKAKLEWQGGVDESAPDIFKNIIQFRPSGVRVKPGTYFPTLVAMVQKSIIGPEKRYMTPRECARIQGFPEDFKICSSEMQAYKQFGNSVNVEVVRLFAKFLFGDKNVRQEYSHNNQFGEPEIIQDVLI
jgi:DNA (cytosine-5)-methyltransferase 1